MAESKNSASVPADRRRLRVEIRGAVQGVGFRPFVYRLALDLGLTGWVINDSRGVRIEVEGEAAVLKSFRTQLQTLNPPLSVLHSVDSLWLDPQGFEEFEIRQSRESGVKSVVMLPDVATCSDCLSEVLDPGDRRFAYPFTNCTHCGPRFSIIRALPYDRPNTTMQRFEMCPDCRREYEEPLDRRFHAQPNACPVCGPRIELWDRRGEVLARASEALQDGASALAEGTILALKGLGGFHLMVDARNEEAVDLLRQRKGRYEKPLALMVRDLEMAKSVCDVSATAEALLISPAAPIVLMPIGSRFRLAAGIAPGNPQLGVMLPYTPLHHLLFQQVDCPLVATSGNLSDEPICTTNAEALARLAAIADCFLVHDRPIHRHVDDSVLHLMEGETQPVRRARGLAPMPLILGRPGPVVLAVGGHLKNVVALSVGDRVFLSQHIGDMETPQAFGAFEAVIRDFLAVYDAEPDVVAHDLHPDYPTTRWAFEAVAGQSGDWQSRLAGKPTVGVQHHHAHLAACLVENHIEGPALGITWDGTGYGTDATVWGGEFLLGDTRDFQRVAHLRRFRLPGGDAAVKEPRRVALAVLWEMWGENAFDREDLAPIRAIEESERRLLATMLAKGFRSPVTSSAGRLFDAVAALIDVRQRVSFEGQAAMALEFMADAQETGSYSFALRAADGEPETLELDWQPIVEGVIEDSQRHVDPGIIAGRFHNTLVEALVAVAERIGETRVALTGGCFQNRLLTERAASRLRESGLDVLIHRQVPANDGGISLGQVAIAAARFDDDTDGSGKEQ
jgi:hydrogenase maturation protein HypF